MATAKLTPKEIELMVAVVTSGELQVSDWNAIAKLANMSTAKYSRDMWNGIKKKLKADSKQPSDGEGEPDGSNDNADTKVDPPVKKKATAKKPATPRKRKAKEPVNDDEDDYERPLKKTPGTATAKGRTPRKKANKPAEEEEEEPVKEEEWVLVKGEVEADPFADAGVEDAGLDEA